MKDNLFCCLEGVRVKMKINLDFELEIAIDVANNSQIDWHTFYAVGKLH